jgi:DNA primase
MNKKVDQDVNQKQMKTFEGINHSMFAYFNQILKLRESTKGWYRSECLMCGNRTSFGINFNYSRCKCHRCGYQAKLINFVAEINNFNSYYEAIKFLKDGYGDYFKAKVKTPEKVELKEMELPESFSLISFGNSAIGKAARDYLKHKRGLNLTRLAMRGVGYCSTGKYEGSIIFPWYKSGKLIYFNDRRFIPAFGPKFHNPDSTEYGVGKESLLYNWDALFLYRHIYVVESVINANTLGDTAIALGGKSMSEDQLSHILNSPIKSVTIIYDPDALKEAIQVCIKLAKYKKVRLVTWQGKDDVNSLGKKKTLNIVKKHKFRPLNFYVALMIRYYAEPTTIYSYLQS